MKNLLSTYLKTIAEKTMRLDSTESSYYGAVETLFSNFPLEKGRKTKVTVLPKPTEAGNPDFRVWDGENFIVGYIEAKLPGDLDNPKHQEQFDRYVSTFPNVILTDFYEFRLFRDGVQIDSALIARHLVAKLKQTPNLENIADFERLANAFFEFKLPKTFTAQQLATQLAKRTRFLRDIVHDQLQEELDPKRGKLYYYFHAFRKFLIPSLNPETFADLYAQTIAYGLFAARTRIPASEAFSRRSAFDYIPHTVGILQELFRYISLEDPSDQMKIIIDDIASVLNASDINSILDQYYKQGKGEDPIIHFYETFLNEYDPATREARGVYYTPEPVVKYIVRSVHELLKSEFGLSDGLATKGVTLLDPAAGTLTFPAEAIKLAVQEYVNKYGEGGKEGFIRDQILPNFYAFELMMAPYAIGHMKVAYLLEALGFKMRGEDAFKLYLTNTLEMEDIQQAEVPGIEALSAESHNAGRVKQEPILVILGNPPYSGISSNINKWTEKLLKTDLDGAQSFYKVDGSPLGERKLWLQDDYVKFLRFAQWKIQKAGKGIVAMITNHAWLDNPTFRGMRQSLIQTFDQIYILNLHGNSMKKETAPDGGKDENVFDIRTGVAISIFVKNGKSKKGEISHAEIFGYRKAKYQWLGENSYASTSHQTLSPMKPYYLLVPFDTSNMDHYLDWRSIKELFPSNVTGIVTARDSFIISQTEDELLRRITQFRNLELTDDLIKKAYKLKDTRGWSMSVARKALAQQDNWEDKITKISYRPFDNRYVYYSEDMVDWPRQELMPNMLEKNLGIITVRQSKTGSNWSHAFIVDNIVESCLVSSQTSEIGYLFPLYLYPNQNQLSEFLPLDELPQPIWKKSANIDSLFIKTLEATYSKNIDPEDFLYYVYAVLYSPTYRETYAPFLKIDYPRIPFTSDPEVFEEMARLGERLKDLHLLRSEELEDSTVRFQGTGDDIIRFRRYDPDQKRLYINKDKYFENLDPEVWHYQIGGYQVLDKYIKDRKDQPLTDPRHIIRIATALARTLEIQSKIDESFPRINRNYLVL
jgi:type I restriction-modification system DNA methylase subunit